MTYISRKTPEAIRSEVKTVEDYTDQVFGLRVDLQSFKGQIEDLAIAKVRDYVHQRFKDWPVKDLLSLYGIIEQIQVERCQVELEPEPEENKAARTKVVKRGS